MKIFEKLTKEDLQLLLDAPAFITILIGSADGNLDEDEIWAGSKVAHIKKFTEDRILQAYYTQVAEAFDERILKLIAVLPKDAETRNTEISEKLSNLNEIYKNLDRNFVEELNKSFRSLASEVAKASGGILGFGSESYEEKQWVELKMIKNK